MAEECAARVRLATSRLQASREQTGASEHGSDATRGAAAYLSAALAEPSAVCVDMRALARSMGASFEAEIERHVTAAYRQASPATLRVHTGAPLNLFDPAAWVACGTAFFYGDCAPNLERPAKISW